ncbi:HipA domain-containing protein [Helicobacter sp. MIT 01-3238]|uniref:HipA domain-containing protein n=1 Tax=Helicobacter sp. MIT 01-3238 TaxID=398627 RepID=UPI000E1EC1C6|nr:HipA domain-containing protein [Helicobacter sp. MIT 01-3238]RDU52098.1 hypothetical protein CQA40_08215 [Helicobacter sp. MIT 01-3238]
MPSILSNKNQTNETYIYKQHKLYAKLLSGEYYLLKNNSFVLANDEINEILDILPEGIDLKIMQKSFNVENPIELLPYLRNTIGDFDFSHLSTKTNFDKPIMSNLSLDCVFPKILDCQIDINPSALYPSRDIDPKNNGIQVLSLSGAQHKLQVSITNNVIAENYGDFILKPDNEEYSNLAVNEHLNMSFMREFGFEVPFNALVCDRHFGEFHYVVKRFDIDENGNKMPQITLNALTKSKRKEIGNIEDIATFLRDRLDNTEKIKFIRYIYANALLHNNDLHKKNISFVFKDNKLKLSPAYDILNIYPIRKLENTQCLLLINNKQNNIKIDDFHSISQNLGVDFTQTRENLNQILDTYLNKYPEYIKKLSDILKKHPTRNVEIAMSFKDFRNKLLDSYDKCQKNKEI